MSIQASALGRQGRGGQGGDAPGQGEDVLQQELQAPGDGIVADLDDVGDVARQMRQAGLVLGGMALLGGLAVRDPHRRLVHIHHLAHHDSAARRRGHVHHGLR